jgi:hypothetical protein
MGGKAKKADGKRKTSKITATTATADKTARQPGPEGKRRARTTARAAKVAKEAKKALKKAARKAARRVKERRFVTVDTDLFLALTEGERAAALRILLEDKRLAPMAKVGRYRVIAVEPVVVKPPHALVGHRLARVVAYDYASDRSVEACCDLDEGSVAHLQVTRAQPMLAREEEAAAVSIALADERVKEQLGLGDLPQAAMQYWSWRESDLAYSRRSAAVLFGQDGARPSWVVVVDLIDNQVAELVPGDQW